MESLTIFAATKANSSWPETPVTISCTRGRMMVPSISGVQSFRPSKMYIISANMTMPKELHFVSEFSSRKPTDVKSTPSSRHQIAPLILPTGPKEMPPMTVAR